MKKKIILLLPFCFISQIVFGQIAFQKTYGGTSSDYCESIQQTSDGGYIMCGTTLSFGAGLHDIYLVKVNASGDIAWTETYGGALEDYGISVQQTYDEGYIITGYTTSFGAGGNTYLIKVDAYGNLIWSKIYSGIQAIYHGYFVRQTNDRGYIITGVGSGAGDWDVGLIKTDSVGNLLWSKSYGGNIVDYGNSVEQTGDGGYIVAGWRAGFCYLIKTDANGNLIWSKLYRGGNSSMANSVKQTTDGGYIVAGYNTIQLGIDIYLIKTDSSGNLVWSKTYGGTGDDEATSVEQTDDGGYVIAGITTSFGAGSWDIYFQKTDSSGDIIWARTFGGSGLDCGGGDDWSPDVTKTNDGGFVIGGWTDSFGSGNADVYIIKTNSSGISACDQGSTKATVTITVTQVITPATIVTTNNTEVITPPTIVGDGGITTILCSTPTGIEEQIKETGISIFPNPVTNELGINPAGLKINKIELYDLLGQCVFYQKPEANSQKQIVIDVSSFTPGMYFVNLQTSEGIVTKKFLIAR